MKDNSETSNTEHSKVQEVEVEPLDPREDIAYDYEVKNEHSRGTSDDFRSPRDRYGIYYNANNLPSCCSGCGIFILLLAFAFFIAPQAFIKAIFIIAGVTVFSVQLLRIALISRTPFWVVWIIPPFLLTTIAFIGVFFQKPMISFSDVCIGTIVTFAVMSLTAIPKKQ